ncbi:MAG: glycosyltransferase, partial [Candidatus Heimdallarchaeota archaeon]|nr:glycosyltransferase [Candidatus Heimdallarchaeota archaeon]
INCFNYTNPVLEKVINSTYNKVIKIKPEVWEYLYDNPKIVKRSQKLRSMIHKFNSKKLKKLIKKFNPEAIACTQAFPCGMIADFKKTYNLEIPLVGVLTDYYPHSYWMFDNVNGYIVPSDKAKERLVNGGVKAEKVYVYGIPISPTFSKPLDRDFILENLDLDPKLPTVLIMGGGQGLGPIEDLVFSINTIERPLQVIVVCGINKKLKKSLEKRRKLFRKNMTILGYTKQTNVLMDIADLIVTKPGGLTTAESLTKSLPIVIVNPIPGQEAKNTEFLIEEGVAVKARNTLDAAVLIADLLNNPQKLKKMQAAALHHAKPDSAVNSAKLLLKLMHQEK